MLRLLRPTWLLHIMLGLFVMLDTAYSFQQHFQEPLDGDLAAIVVPHPLYEQVLTDPLGVRAAWYGERYAAPNRFFVHATMSAYFWHAPLLFQRFTTPLDSAYLACAALKTAIQLLIIGLLAAYVVIPLGGSWRNYLLALALMTPLFHVRGYNMQMGFIDPSITYTIFYALPSGLLLLFFLPFYRAFWAGRYLQLNWLSGVGLASLALVLAFSGPLVPGILALMSPLGLGRLALKNWQTHSNLTGTARLRQALLDIPKGLFALLLVMGLACVYSLYVGSHNSEDQWVEVSLLTRYLRLPAGVYHQITPKLGIPLLLLMLLLNRCLLRRYAVGPMGGRLLGVLQWIGIFSVVYLLLLPLGGYRSYRPNILRRDTVQPLLIMLMYWYAISSVYLLRTLSGRPKQWYMAGVVLFVAGFTVADKPNTGENACERAGLEELAASTEKIVRLKADCPIMEWRNLSEPAMSEMNVRLLTRWRVLNDVEKRYYQPEKPKL